MAHHFVINEHSSDGLGITEPKIWVLEDPTQVRQSYLSFFPTFFPYLMIFQSEASRTLKNHQTWKKLREMK